MTYGKLVRSAGPSDRSPSPALFPFLFIVERLVVRQGASI